MLFFLEISISSNTSPLRQIQADFNKYQPISTVNSHDRQMHRIKCIRSLQLCESQFQQTTRHSSVNNHFWSKRFNSVQTASVFKLITASSPVGLICFLLGIDPLLLLSLDEIQHPSVEHRINFPQRMPQDMNICESTSDNKKGWTHPRQGSR